MKKFSLIEFIAVCFLVCIAVFLVFNENGSIIINIIGVIYSYCLFYMFTKTKFGILLIKGYMDLYKNLINNLGLED